MMKRFKHPLVIGLLAFGVIALLGRGSYSVFYEEMMIRMTGEGIIDWEKIASLCGWAGKANPGESEWGYRLRSTWNMISSKMAMTAFTIVILFSFYGIVRLVFWITEKRN